MSRRINESARILDFFRVADLGKAEVLYDLVRECMSQRLAPGKAAKKAVAAKRKKVSEVAQPAAPHAADQGNGGVSAG